MSDMVWTIEVAGKCLLVRRRAADQVVISIDGDTITLNYNEAWNLIGFLMAELGATFVEAPRVDHD